MKLISTRDSHTYLGPDFHMFNIMLKTKFSESISIHLITCFRKYTLGGAYRKMLAIPSDISWRIMRYKERYDDLILCDVDEMRGLPEPKEDPGV